MPRDKLIEVSDEELDLLRDIAHEEFGTNDLPYGAVISYLAQQHERDDNII